VTIHRCLNGCAPLYLSDYCVPDAGADTRRHLRSANRQLLIQYLATGSTLTDVGPFQLLAPKSGTLSRISSGTRLSVQTVSDVCIKRTCSLDASAFSALEVFDDNRALWMYLLTYLRSIDRPQLGWYRPWQFRMQQPHILLGVFHVLDVEIWKCFSSSHCVEWRALGLHILPL